MTLTVHADALQARLLALAVSALAAEYSYRKWLRKIGICAPSQDS